MNRLDERLNQAASTLSEAEREASIHGPVRRFVRLNRRMLVDLHVVAGSWSRVASLLAAEGLRWRSGQMVTGPQLRALVSAVEAKARRGSRQSAGMRSQVPPSPATPERAPAERLGGLAALLDIPSSPRRSS